MKWCRELGQKCRRSELLKKHTTFKIGGPARFFIEPPDVRRLQETLRAIQRKKLSFKVLGMGSNVLVGDRGFGGAVLRLRSPCFRKVSFGRAYVIAGAGLALSQLLRNCYKKGFSGFEFLAGIPGTVGGALVMNAGIQEKSIADIIESITVLDKRGSVRILKKRDIHFSYRGSNLGSYVVLSGRFKAHKESRGVIKARMEQLRASRRLTQDYAFPSAGCIFKNPPGDAAGRLIDTCGLKGAAIGGAAVSLKHANFIINRKKARAADVFKLMGLIKRKVKNKFGVTLKPEIEIWK